MTAASTSLPHEQLDELQRQGNPNIRTLSLALGQWCSVWYLKSITTNFRRRVAEDEFYDQVEEERLALNREAESTFDELKQKYDDLEEDVTERMQCRVEDL